MSKGKNFMSNHHIDSPFSSENQFQEMKILNCSFKKIKYWEYPDSWFRHWCFYWNASPGAWIVSGGAPVYAAAALSCFCFSRLCAGMGMAVLLTADVAAALIGRRFGKHKFSNGKSWEGTLSFFIVGMLAVLVCAWFSGRISLTLYAFPAVFCGTLAELFQKTLRLDDNFLIPVLTAGILQFTLILAGIPC